MPIPKTKNIGKIMSFLKKDKPNMSMKQRVAIALSQARKAGAKVPKKKYKKKNGNLNNMVMTAVTGVRG